VFGLFGFWIVDASIGNTGLASVCLGWGVVLLSLCSNFFVVRLLIDTCGPAACFVERWGFVVLVCVCGDKL
jgi:hypothetical protein